MAERNICLTNDSFPPVIDGVANAVTNYARVIEKDYVRQRCQHIQLGDGIGRPLDAVQLGADGLQQLGKKAVFQRDEALVGTEDLAFQLLKFLGDVALAAGERLLADVGLRHQIFVAVADLDEVTKDVVVADLQLGDHKTGVCDFRITAQESKTGFQ